MKLLPLLLLICMDVAGQLPDSLSGTSLTSGTSTMTISSGTTLTRKVQEPKYDTVRVIMLVCDTQWSTQTYSYSNTKYDIDFTIDLSKIVRWQYGYEVREKRSWSQLGDMVCWQCPDYLVHIDYLDERRRPLSKSIIVWQSIKL